MRICVSQSVPQLSKMFNSSELFSSQDITQRSGTIKWNTSYRAKGDCPKGNRINMDEDIRATLNTEATAIGFQRIIWIKTGCIINCHSDPNAFSVTEISNKEQI